MKKFFIAIVLCLVCTVSFGQRKTNLSDETYNIENILNDTTLTVEFRVYNIEGDLLSTYSSSTATKLFFNAGSLSGYYMVEIHRDGDKVTLRYIVKPDIKELDIKELISLRNNYQNEYDLLENEWFLRNLNENGKYCDKQHNILYSTYEEFCREKVLKDSIEILNVMINNYQF